MRRPPPAAVASSSSSSSSLHMAAPPHHHPAAPPSTTTSLPRRQSHQYTNTHTHTHTPRAFLKMAAIFSFLVFVVILLPFCVLHRPLLFATQTHTHTPEEEGGVHVQTHKQILAPVAAGGVGDRSNSRGLRVERGDVPIPVSLSVSEEKEGVEEEEEEEEEEGERETKFGWKEEKDGEGGEEGEEEEEDDDDPSKILKDGEEEVEGGEEEEKEEEEEGEEEDDEDDPSKIEEEEEEVGEEGEQNVDDEEAEESSSSSSSHPSHPSSSSTSKSHQRSKADPNSLSSSSASSSSSTNKKRARQISKDQENLHRDPTDSPPPRSDLPITSTITYTPITTTTSFDETFTLTHDFCQAHYGARRYLTPQEERIPPVLYSYPGSGNTFTRLLIDYATGVYTGSIHDDVRLNEALPGQQHCSPQVVAVKAHPFNYRPSQLFSAKTGDKCRKEGGLVQGFGRFVLLLRDPYASIWSEFQRQELEGSHDGSLTLAELDYKEFRRRCKKFTERYIEMLQDFQEVEERVGKENVIYIRYEDLLDKGKRTGELKKLVRFLGLEGEEEIHRQTDTHTHTGGKGEEERRLECAFLLADRPETHRGSGRGGDGREETHTQGKKRKKKLSKEDVYGPKLVCAIWGLLEQEEDMLIEYGYGPEKLPFGLKCD